MNSKGPMDGFRSLALPALFSLIFSVCCHGQSAASFTGVEIVSPLDHQVFQRSTKDIGVIQVTGRLARESGAGVVETRLSDSAHAEGWRLLASLPAGSKSFDATRLAPAGGWHKLELRVRSGSEIVAAGVVLNVGVGEVFVIAGQSNSANHGEKRQVARSGMTATFDGKAWRPADDPQPGASGDGGSFIPPFADAVAERFHVPVGIVATGVGATSVREWLPKGDRMTNPPTLLGNVTQLPSGEWESKGAIFESFTTRVKSLGASGFRAVLWHQGESDANQRDASRTLSGALYHADMERLIRESRRVAGWEFPWFTAQATYHTPDDPGSPEIRAAQKGLWVSGLSLEGPDTDALAGEFRDAAGQGVHFSDKGLREHAARWVEKVAPWLDQQLLPPKTPGAPPKLRPPSFEAFEIAGRPAFVFMPKVEKQTSPQPWIFYAPTLPGYPDEAERWMHGQFLDAGVAVAGVDVGEAYGSPASHQVFNALYDQLVKKRSFAAKPCLFGRSRGGLWVSSWALSDPSRVAGIIGIYPVYDFRTYPGLTNAAPAYGVSPAELLRRVGDWNPVARLGLLAKAGVPVALIHGDVDTVVPLKENSGEMVRLYREAGAGDLVKLIVLEGQGHNFFEGFFHSRELVDFAIARACAGAAPR